MSDPKAQQEPSMEEILASIRRIISEDDEAAGGQSGEAEAAVAEAEPPAELEPEPEDEIEAIIEETAEEEPEPEVEPLEEQAEEPAIEPVDDIVEDTGDAADQDDDVLELTELADDEPEPDPVTDDALVSSATEAEAANSLSRLSESVATTASSTLAADIGIGNSDTLEEVVKQLLRPLLREWLDANLPGIVEHAVDQEVKRLSRTYRGRG